MAITDIVILGSICSEMARSPGTLNDIIPPASAKPCAEIARGDIGTITEVNYMSRPCVELANSGTVIPDVSTVAYGIQYGNSGTQYTGALIVGGMAWNATLAKESGANARGNSGTCAKLTPLSNVSFGYWHFYIPVSGSPFTFSFWHKISSGWNGSLNVTIFDIDQSTKLLSSQSVTLVNDGNYHQYISSGCLPPSGIGMCLIRIEIQDGNVTGYVFIDDVGAV